MNLELLGTWTSIGEAELKKMVGEILVSLTEPATIFLDAQMGAGKTTLAKLFIDDKDSMSPSYSVLNETDEALHADFYRIKSTDELIHLELELYLKDKKFFFIEWGKGFIDQLREFIPSSFSYYLIEIIFTDKELSTRTYKLYNLNFN